MRIFVGGLVLAAISLVIFQSLDRLSQGRTQRDIIAGDFLFGMFSEFEFSARFSDDLDHFHRLSQDEEIALVDFIQTNSYHGERLPAIKQFVLLGTLDVRTSGYKITFDVLMYEDFVRISGANNDRVAYYLDDAKDLGGILMGGVVRNPSRSKSDTSKILDE